MRYALRAHCDQQAAGNRLPQVRQQKSHSSALRLCHLQQWKFREILHLLLGGRRKLLRRRLRLPLSRTHSGHHSRRADSAHRRLIILAASFARRAAAALYAGRITKTIRLFRLKNEKKSSSCFQGPYFLFSSRMPCSASSPLTISARASAQSPNNFPRTSQGATRARPLLRIRLALPESAVL